LGFTRNIAATNEMQRALTPGNPQPVVVAWGDKSVNKASYHEGRQGMQDVDFGSGIADHSLVSLACTKETTFALAVVVTFVALALTTGPGLMVV